MKAAALAAFVFLLVASSFAKKFDSLEPVPKEFQGKYAVSTLCKPEYLYDFKRHMTGVRIHFSATFADFDGKNEVHFEWPDRQWVGSEDALQHQEDFCIFFSVKMRDWNRTQRKLAYKRAAKEEKPKHSSSPVRSAFKR